MTGCPTRWRRVAKLYREEEKHWEDGGRSRGDIKRHLSAEGAYERDFFTNPWTLSPGKHRSLRGQRPQARGKIYVLISILFCRPYEKSLGRDMVRDTIPLLQALLLEGIGIFLWYTILRYVKGFPGFDTLSYLVPCSPVNINLRRGRASWKRRRGKLLGTRSIRHAHNSRRWMKFFENKTWGIGTDLDIVRSIQCTIECRTSLATKVAE
jgi:hypothetical protein